MIKLFMLLIKDTHGDKPLSLTYKINYVNMRNSEVYMWIDYVNVFLFVLGFSSQSRIFHSYGDVTTTAVKGCKFLTYARHLWPLSSDRFLAFSPHCNTGHPFIMVIS